jgi:hypothetical protein
MHNATCSTTAQLDRILFARRVQSTADVCQANTGQTPLAVGPKVTLTFQWPTDAHTSLMEEVVATQHAPYQHFLPQHQHSSTQHQPAALAGTHRGQAAQVSTDSLIHLATPLHTAPPPLRLLSLKGFS